MLRGSLLGGAQGQGLQLRSWLEWRRVDQRGYEEASCCRKPRGPQTRGTGAAAPFSHFCPRLTGLGACLHPSALLEASFPRCY